MTPPDGFALLREALEMAGARFAIGGSWASTAFGEPRMTNDVDVLADFTLSSLDAFLGKLPESFFFDRDEARKALIGGRPFNVIYMPTAFKFDFFSAAAYPLGAEELERAIFLERTALSESATPFVTPEDILLAKLHWYRAGGEVSDVQWRDIAGIIRNRGERLDREYLARGAAKLGVADLLKKVFSGAA